MFTASLNNIIIILFFFTVLYFLLWHPHCLCGVNKVMVVLQPITC